MNGAKMINKDKINDDISVCSCTVIHDDIIALVKSQMLEQNQFEKLSLFFKAISDETRIKILYSLSKSEMCVCDLASLLNMTVSAISHQLRLLKQAELVRSDKRGKVVYYCLSDNHVTVVFQNAIDHINE